MREEFTTHWERPEFHFMRLCRKVSLFVFAAILVSF